MKSSLSRRGLIGLVPSALLAPSFSLSTQGVASSGVHPLYPSHHPDAVKEIVSASHGNLERVREMLKQTPALAKSAWDWGFGDWEDSAGGGSAYGSGGDCSAVDGERGSAGYFCVCDAGEFGCGADVGEAESGDSEELGAARDYFAWLTLGLAGRRRREFWLT